MNLKFLLKVLSTPTAPFREKQVLTVLENELARNQVPYFFDPIGNLILGVKSNQALKSLLNTGSDEPLRIFIAHTDHPGFHGSAWETPSTLKVKWHGGSPTTHLTGARVWLADERGWAGEGIVKQATLTASKWAMNEAILSVKLNNASRPKPSTLFGGFRFRAPVWKKGSVLYTKAADDLVGSFAISELAVQWFKKNRKSTNPPFIGILTRAEEVGCIGLLGHLKLGWLTKSRRPLVAISLETSRTLPGAHVGKGPVVRLGDRSTVFHSASLKVFSDIANQVLPRKHQKRVMDGGTCEGSVTTALGIPTVGISVPLGNYHNQGFEGGPDCLKKMGPAPEFVHLKDVEGMITLCKGLLEPRLHWQDPWKKQLIKYGKLLNSYKRLLG